MEPVRLNKYLAEIGVGSRRSIDVLIQESRVKVNGVIAELGAKVDPERDEVLVDNKKVGQKQDKVYYVLNKPRGYITTSSDPHGRKKVIDLAPRIPRVYPVGRLDSDTSGLLVLTNDGELTHRMTHPSFEKEKEYEVDVRGGDVLLLGQLKKGVKLEEGIAKADKIEALGQKDGIMHFRIVIHQGWNRQIRRMCEALGLEVLKLKRVRMGKLRLGELREGEWREIKKEDIL